MHEYNCSCVICSEWSGRFPLECEQIEIPDEDYPDPFEEVLGG